MNWPKGKKWLVTCTLASMTWVITFASSVFSTATVVTAKKFGVSNEVMILGTSLFILGFSFGPLLWGPLSELYGRRIPLFFGFFVFVRHLTTFLLEPMTNFCAGNFPDTCCSRSKPSNHYDLPLFRWFLRLRSSSHCRWHVGRLLGSRRPRRRSLHICCCDLYRKFC
jgi:MFS family permease